MLSIESKNPFHPKSLILIVNTLTCLNCADLECWFTIMDF